MKKSPNTEVSGETHSRSGGSIFNLVIDPPPWLRLLFTTACILIVSWYFLFILKWARNIPYNDDIWDILQFFLNFMDAGSLREQLASLLEPHVDHRTTASKLVYLFLQSLQGEINFVTLDIVANLGLVVIAVLFAMQWREPDSRYLVLLCASLLLFQPRAIETMFWPTAGFAYIYVNMYGLAAIALLQRTGGWRFWSAVALTWLATFTMAAGQLVWIAGLAYLLYQRREEGARPLQHIGIWTLNAILCIFFFQYGWEGESSTFPLAQLIAEKPGLLLRYFLAALGSAFSYGSVFQAQLSGILLLAALCFITIRDWHRGLIALHVFGWFMVLQCAAVTSARARFFYVWDDVLTYAIVSRVGFLSMVLSVTVLFGILARSSPMTRKLRPVALLLCFLNFTAGYHYYTPEVEKYWRKRVYMYNIKRYGGFFQAERDEGGVVVLEAARRGLYDPPQRRVTLPQ